MNRKKKKRGRTVQRERRIYHGEYLDVHIFPVFQKPGKRGKKRNPSTEVQRLLNQKYREERVTYLIHSNFDVRDIEIKLGFDDEHLPESYSDFQRIMRNFIRAVKRMRVKYGLKEMKYIYVIERGKRNGRWHAHMITNGADGEETVLTGYDDKGKPIHRSYRSMFEELWEKYGGTKARSFSLDFNDEGLSGLSKYKVKEPETEIAEIDEKVRRWAASKNLNPPTIPKDRDGFISRDMTREIREGKYTERDIERLYPGYTVSTIQPLLNEVNKGEYLTIRLRKTQASRVTKEVFTGTKNKKNRRRR